MEGLTLYQISSAFPVLMEKDDLTEEEKTELRNELTILLEQKSEEILAYIINTETDIEGMKQEEKRLASLRKARENRITRFKDEIKKCITMNNLGKIQTKLGTLSVAKSPISVEITNEDEISEEFKKVIMTTQVDKTKIKEHFKETGEVPAGTNIVTTNTNLRIK